MRLTPDELARLDALGPVRSDSLRGLLDRATVPRKVTLAEAEQLWRDLVRGHDDSGRPVVAIPLSGVE